MNHEFHVWVLGVGLSVSVWDGFERVKEGIVRTFVCTCVN